MSKNIAWKQLGALVLALAAFTTPAFAGEADIKIPDLTHVHFDGLGGVSGLTLGISIVLLTQWLVPAMPAAISPFYVILALVIAVVIGLLAGVLPARAAAQLEPLDALRAE